MPLPDAVPGLVFRYEYSWKRQALAGQTAGEKDRPACVVLSITGKSATRRVLIVPVTTKFPGDDIPAIEIPRRVKSHLGLDPEIRSWIILSEANLDTWPTPDMRQIPGKPGCFEYGLLPEKMVNAIRTVMTAGLAQKRLLLVNRDPDQP